MKRTAAALLAVVAMAAAAAAQTPPAWVTFRSPDGQFSARFPVAPTLSTNAGKNADGQPIAQYLLSSVEGGNAFQIGYFDIAPDQTFSLPDARDGILRNIKGTLVGETAITIGPYSGTDLVITGAWNSTEFAMNARVIHTPRRAYIVQVLYPRAAPDQSEKTARFFGSFQITR